MFARPSKLLAKRELLSMKDFVVALVKDLSIRYEQISPIAHFQPIHSAQDV